jgi:Cu2+-exporting ATPase
VRLLSGDGATAVARVADAVGIETAQGACSPQDKLAFLREAQGQGHQVAMVGDGLNDGPGLAGAHVSFAFGKAVPLAQSQADFVVMGDQLAAVAQTVQLARRTMRIVRQNLWWAAGYNAVCVPLAVVGLAAGLAGGSGHGAEFPGRGHERTASGWTDGNDGHESDGYPVLADPVVGGSGVFYPGRPLVGNISGPI